MSTPRRWLEDTASATPMERDLLRAGLDADPPPDAKAAIWSALMTQIPPPVAPGAGQALGGKAAAAGSGGGAGAAGAVGGGILKSALIGAGSALALIAAYTVVAPSKPEAPPPPALTAPEAPSASARTPLSGAPGAAPSARPDDTTSPSARPAAPPSAATASSAALPAPPRDPAAGSAPAIDAEPASAADRESRMLEESRRLAEARNTLRRGDAAGALAALEELRQKFPGGGLGQEREALMIEALYQGGRRAEAASRAEAFLKAYPTSPHATRVQAFTK